MVPLLSVHSHRLTRPSDPTPTTAGPIEGLTLIGKLDADRVCRKCLHQLHGTQVYRDARLDLPVVRCSECGTTAAVTEFPYDWKWLRRGGILLAAFAALVCFLLLAGDVAAIATGSFQCAYETTRPVSSALGQAGQAQDPKATWTMTPEFLADTIAIERVVSDPEVQGRVRGRVLFSMIPLSIIAVIGGVLWSGVLLHRRVWWALLFQCLPLALAAGFATIAFISERPFVGNGWTYSSFALAHYGWTYLWLGVAWITALRIIAVLLARPLIRAFLWIVVPKRVRQAVVSVWTDVPMPQQNPR